MEEIKRQFQEINSNIISRDFVKAKEVLLLIDINKYPMYKGEYYLLMSEVLLSLGEVKQEYAENAVLIYRSTSEHHKYALAKYLLGWQKQLLGSYVNAKESLNEAWVPHRLRWD